MIKNLILIIGLIITIFLFSGCIDSRIDTGFLVKEGIVTQIKYDVVFGGTFTDWRNDVYFDDGTILWVEQDNDLSSIRVNRSGKFYFQKNYFEYDKVLYKFHDFKGVEYKGQLVNGGVKIG